MWNQKSNSSSYLIFWQVGVWLQIYRRSEIFVAEEFLCEQNSAEKCTLVAFLYFLIRGRVWIRVGYWMHLLRDDGCEVKLVSVWNF